ncbi:GNAT family N-acetyltransferase/peptidase C39 family protein [Teredinibacter turnerae]|uniref:GNAT family N-acetyltransferase/peptidase C39 family protein n=1 Tax=Teredinibacter turnerae TaxID=2426 RepID=UPI00037DEA3E|nr:GNAT family N-acetyltransferase/peptidase C39 family protein [Teredinibacter turnerae]
MDTTDIRRAQLGDLNALLALEQACFSNDRLSKRSFRHFIQASQSTLLVAEHSGAILAYGLVWHHKGTRLARLYSLAVSPEARGAGLASRLLARLEQNAAERGRLYMRLEVAKNNTRAIALYQARDYRIFGEYSDYYDDHTDALRMQKQIRTLSQEGAQHSTPWYQQTTEFSCGPASLMMAMASFSNGVECSQTMELDIWREATTIFMTSGHGGCHPLGLALAARRREFEVQAWINNDQPLFLDGVRSDHKKSIMAVVHNHFVTQCAAEGVAVNYAEVSQDTVEDWLQNGFAVVVLISTYRLDGKKAPHWVVVTGVDDQCFYLHDPDLDTKTQLAIDCQHVPIAREDFARMTAFGSNRLRTAVAIRPATH